MKSILFYYWYLWSKSFNQRVQNSSVYIWNCVCIFGSFACWIFSPWIWIWFDYVICLLFNFLAKLEFFSRSRLSSIFTIRLLHYIPKWIEVLLHECVCFIFSKHARKWKYQWNSVLFVREEKNLLYPTQRKIISNQKNNFSLDREACDVIEWIVQLKIFCAWKSKIVSVRFGTCWWKFKRDIGFLKDILCNKNKNNTANRKQGKYGTHCVCACAKCANCLFL